jgi:signal transduction histidine kinase
MKNVFATSLKSGFRFFRNSPQIFSTILIAFLIIAGFIFSAWRFSGVATNAQELLTRDRVLSVLDVFASFAQDQMDSSHLEDHVIRIKEENETFKVFKVIRASGDKYEIVASANKEEVGQLDFNNSDLYGIALGQPGNSLYFKIPLSDGSPGYRAVRAIVGPQGVVGLVYLEVSLANAEQLISRGIQVSYIILIGIIILIMVLFFRHARIIDYTKLYADLEGVTKMKDDFLSMASHELRTPLTIIRGYADLVLGAKNLSEQDRKNVANIGMAANQLNLLVGDMLDISRIEQGKLSFTMEPIETTSVVREIAETFIQSAKEKGLSFIIEVPELPSITVDKDRLRQVLVNVIGNAIKYTPKGEVRVTGGLDEERRVSLRVSDTGLGISAEDQKKLFQKFYRVKNEETQGITGTGLGLWITKTLVEQMGGEISVESIRGTGSHFIFAFPQTSSLGAVPDSAKKS